MARSRGRSAASRLTLLVFATGCLVAGAGAHGGGGGGGGGHGGQQQGGGPQGGQQPQQKPQPQPQPQGGQQGGNWPFQGAGGHGGQSAPGPQQKQQQQQPQQQPQPQQQGNGGGFEQNGVWVMPGAGPQGGQQPQQKPQQQPQQQQQQQQGGQGPQGGPQGGKGGGGGGGGGGDGLDLISLAAYPGAICNDGTPAGYYFQRSPTGSNQWLIYLMGGMWCWDQQSCQLRMQDAGFQTSSKGWQKSLSIGAGVGGVSGVFNSQDGSNPWANANKVYGEYCSSDAWVGNADASAATWNIAFKGQVIVSAIFADLAANQGLAPGADVTFGGCSAGARGALLTLDYVGDMLPSGSTLKGLLDSGVWVDVEPLDTQEVSLQEQTQLAYGLINPQGRINPQCASQNAGSEWKCMYGQYALPFVHTPYFLQMSQFDSFSLLYDTGGATPQSPAQLAYADSYQQAALAVVQQAKSSGNAVFSTTCLVHCLTCSSQDMTGYTANGEDVEQALQSWAQGGTPAVISSCSGYACVASNACPGGSNTYGIQAALQNSSPNAANAANSQGFENNGVWVSTAQGPANGGGNGGGNSNNNQQNNGNGGGNGGSWPWKPGQRGAFAQWSNSHPQQAGAARAGATNWLLQG